MILNDCFRFLLGCGFTLAFLCLVFGSLGSPLSPKSFESLRSLISHGSLESHGSLGSLGHMSVLVGVAATVAFVVLIAARSSGFYLSFCNEALLDWPAITCVFAMIVLDGGWRFLIIARSRNVSSQDSIFSFLLEGRCTFW